jgi:hypothetical protein
MVRFAWACAALVIAGQSFAAEEGVAEPLPDRASSPRALGGHVFMPARLVVSPFTTTSFGLQLLAGGADATTSRYVLTDDASDVTITGTRNQTLAAVGTGLDFDVAVIRNLSLRLRANALVYTGTSGESVLTAGATALYGATLGVTWGHTFGGNKRIALVFDSGTQPELSIVVANAVIDAIRNDRFGSEGLVTDVTRFDNRGGASFAWGITPALGLVAEARFLWSRRTSGEETDLLRRAFLLGGAVDFDLDPLWRVPIGFVASYLASVPTTSDGDTTHDVGFGVFYTRRVRLALGLEFNWREGELRPGIEPALNADSYVAAIRMRYYW